MPGSLVDHDQCDTAHRVGKKSSALDHQVGWAPGPNPETLGYKVRSYAIEASGPLGSSQALTRSPPLRVAHLVRRAIQGRLAGGDLR